MVVVLGIEGGEEGLIRCIKRKRCCLLFGMK